jgi:hypothetical protein
MKLNDVLKNKSYITLVERTLPKNFLETGIAPFGNDEQWALYPGRPDSPKDPFYVFDNKEAATRALDDYTRVGKAAENSAVPELTRDQWEQKYKRNRVTLANPITNYFSKREITPEEMQQRAKNAGKGTLMSKFATGSGAVLMRLLTLVGTAAGPFLAVAVAMDNVEKDVAEGRITADEGKQLLDVLRGQLLIQLVGVLMIVFRSSALMKKGWPVLIVMFGAIGAYGALKESKERVDEAVPLVAAAGALAWQGARMAGSWLLRGAVSRGAATAAAGRAGAKMTGRKALQFLAANKMEIGVSLILSQPDLQRMLAEAIAGWSLSEIVVGSIGNGVEGIVFAADEFFDSSITNFLSDKIGKRPTDGFDQTTIGGEGEYFGNTEWAKLVFGSMLFPPEQKSKLVPYISSGRRDDLLNGVLELNPIDANNVPAPGDPGMPVDPDAQPGPQ